MGPALDCLLTVGGSIPVSVPEMKLRLHFDG